VLGVGEPLVGRPLLIDTLAGSFRTVHLRKDPNCPACGTRTIRELIDYDQFCGITAATSAADDVLAELTPREVADKQRRGDDFDLIDVREPHEWEIARIPGARLVPLASLPSELASFDSAREIVVHCKGGTRSAKAVRLLRNAGFARVSNLTGGITRWSNDVDDSVPRY